MITSKITSKSQTTVPQAVRIALRLKPGDELAYAIKGRQVILSKANLDAGEDPFGSFEEWGSDADREAYGSL